MAYQNVFNHCNEIPWHIIPADKNWYKEYLIAKKIAKKPMAKKVKVEGEVKVTKKAAPKKK